MNLSLTFSMRAARSGSIVDVSVLSRFRRFRRFTFCRNIGSDVTSSPATLELELASHEVSLRRTDSGNLLPQPENKLFLIFFFNFKIFLRGGRQLKGLSATGVLRSMF